ncbi:MAG TPA: zinc ABC transporter substrate-binding protein [Kiritimatiellia bacterium]|nr:zinc ABC transporter substrate-binding protein [Kiritimatiellia bacterium]HMO99854.1 zinc ABC transporter substrate-binding protein [Kiritimatiellia bacterium]HMP96366.1 zinc ABC transporter substrate-binding protein [Kiritimatiellia bacterium]
MKKARYSLLPPSASRLAGALVALIVGGAATGAAEPLRVVATVGMVGDIVSYVAGDRANVQVVIGSGIDPHLYKPTRSDMIKLERAALVFYNGLLLEGKWSDVLTRQAARGKPTIAVAERILAGDYEAIQEETALDPHLWMDVRAWMKAVDVVADALAEHDPENAATYRANAAAYRTRLESLDDYARNAIASIPESRRVLITAHDAFGYFGRAYGMEVLGIQGLSTESEAGLRDIEQLVALLVERRIPAVFVETSVADKNVRALVEGARARGHDVVIGGTLFSDAMGRPGTYEGTYIGMIDHNITAITRALGGVAPSRGMAGQRSDVP